jgi:cephalosporin-C deacetylase-like acetyl esterase
MRKPRLLTIAAAFFLNAAALVSAQDARVQADHKEGVYAVGEKVAWTVTVKDDGAAAAGEISYTVKAGGYKAIREAKAALQDGQAVVEATGSAPGALLLEVRFGKDGHGLGGAVFDWPKIQPSAPAPADFEEFWKSKIAELNAVPMDPVLEKVEINGDVDYWKITMGNIRGTKVYGQIARPKDAKGKLPAFLIVQWAGVYPLNRDWVINRAKAGWLAMNIIAHDQPIDRDKKFYDDLSSGTLKNYPAIGSDNRDTSYFLRMYLSCYRAADYLVGRPDWDGKTLLVEGGSQGGLQAVMLAGLHPAVSAVTASVPAGCDHTGELIGRAPGWPHWIASGGGKDRAKVIEACKYFDVVNFARRAKCPMLIGVGLIDTTCPPEGVIAMFNQLQGPKELVILPEAGHQDKNGSHKAYYSAASCWTEAVRQGKLLPPK